MSRTDGLSAKHILIVGSSGSGKSTLAKWLSARLDIPHIELDGLFWEPNWTRPSPDDFRARVEAAVTGDSWIIDGNYSKVRDLIWPKADMLIWLDLPLWYLPVAGRPPVRRQSLHAVRTLVGKQGVHSPHVLQPPLTIGLDTEHAWVAATEL